MSSSVAVKNNGSALGMNKKTAQLIKGRLVEKRELPNGSNKVYKSRNVSRNPAQKNLN